MSWVSVICVWWLALVRSAVCTGIISTVDAGIVSISVVIISIIQIRGIG